MCKDGMHKRQYFHGTCLRLGHPKRFIFTSGVTHEPCLLAPPLVRSTYVYVMQQQDVQTDVKAPN